MQNTNYFKNNESGADFMARNEHLHIVPSYDPEKAGKFFFVGSCDGVGAVSDRAMEVLKKEMAKPDMTLQKAMCMLEVGTIAGTDIKCIHAVSKPSTALFSC